MVSVFYDNSERQALLLAYSTERKHIIFSHLNEAFEGQNKWDKVSSPTLVEFSARQLLSKLQTLD